MPTLGCLTHTHSAQLLHYSAADIAVCKVGRSGQAKEKGCRDDGSSLWQYCTIVFKRGF